MGVPLCLCCGSGSDSDGLALGGGGPGGPPSATPPGHFFAKSTTPPEAQWQMVNQNDRQHWWPIRLVVSQNDRQRSWWSISLVVSQLAVILNFWRCTRIPARLPWRHSTSGLMTSVFLLMAILGRDRMASIPAIIQGQRAGVVSRTP